MSCVDEIRERLEEGYVGHPVDDLYHSPLASAEADVEFLLKLVTEYREYLDNRYKRMPSVIQSCVGHLNQALLDARASGVKPIVIYDHNTDLFKVIEP